ncbi:MAG: hypothetical protein HRU19_27940 [Pseudobacteriovorax sp.]|nr:hypothetical protein [Pseudobacteriovorax sp.]
MKKYFSRLALKLIIAIALASGLITVGTTAYELYEDYKNDFSEIEKNIDLISDIFIGPLAQAMWDFDETQIDHLANGVLKIKDVAGVEIIPEGEDKKEFGSIEGIEIKKFSLPITHEEKTVGVLTVKVSLTAVYSRLKDKAIFVLISHTGQTAFTSLVIIIIAYFLMTHKLGKIVSALSDYNPEHHIEKDYSNLFSIEGNHFRDEMDDLVHSLKLLMVDLKDYMISNNKVKAELKKLLNEKVKDIESMLENIEQGIFTVDQNGLIHHEYSAYLEEIFETKEIAGKDFCQVLFSHSSLNSEAISCANTAVISSIENPKFAFGVNQSHLPREVKLDLNGKLKVIQIDWCPIIEDDCTLKIMVTVRDVTEFLKFKKASEQKAKELAMIGQVVALDPVKFVEVISANKQLLDQSKLRKKVVSLVQEDFHLVFRNLHTAKGVLRTYGLTTASTAIHELEEKFIHLKESVEELNDSRINDFNAEISLAISVLETYDRIETEILRRNNGDVQIEKESLDEVKKVIALFLEDSVAVEQLYEKVKDILHPNSSICLHKGLQELLDQLNTTAEHLGKAVKLTIRGGKLPIEGDQWVCLEGLFAHIFRNSIDHGIETKEEREELAKSPIGEITVDIELSDDILHVKIVDDGRGINLGKIRERRSFDKDGISAKAVAQSIFAPNFSTKDNVSDISGRGVGMDAVKAGIEQMGGSIDIHVEKEDENGFADMAILIDLPLKMLKSRIKKSA